jgi:hypothetical protein
MNKNKAVLLAIVEGMFSVELPQYVVKAIGKRKTACVLHIMKHNEEYEFFLNTKKIEEK